LVYRGEGFEFEYLDGYEVLACDGRVEIWKGRAGNCLGEGAVSFLYDERYFESSLGYEVKAKEVGGKKYLLVLRDLQDREVYERVFDSLSFLEEAASEGWSLYKSGAGGYQFSYPLEWEIMELGGGGVVVERKDGRGSFLVEYMGGFGKELMDSMVSSSLRLSGWVGEPSVLVFDIGGVEGVLIEGKFEDFWQKFVVFVRGNNLYQISWEDGLERSGEEVFEEIIGGFEFED
jgi:hypothetical protein